MGSVETTRQAIRGLWNALERLESSFGELTDTDVTEALAKTLNFYFVWGQVDRRGTPVSYAMFSPEGDAAVARAVDEFLERAKEHLVEFPIPTGQMRHDVLRDLELKTESGSTCERFIGVVDEPLPADPLWEGRFEPGDYDD